MKTSIVILLLLCATAAFSQATAALGALSNQPVILELPTHPELASPQPLATPHYLSESTGSTFAQGVQPLWEFPVQEQVVSLGEAARLARQQHLLAKKAEKVLSDQR